jgi:hypothetical protein
LDDVGRFAPNIIHKNKKVTVLERKVLMDLVFNLFSAFGLSASAGLNAYIPLLIVALTARFTNLIELSSPWDGLTSWWVIGLLTFLSVIEFFADKIPAVNHINDIVQTFVRPAAGAILFAASARIITDVHPLFSMALGLFVSGSVHAVKSIAVRPAVTATTGGAGNVPVSILEDLVSTVLSVLAIIIPVLIAFFIFLISAWIIWRTFLRRERISKV